MASEPTLIHSVIRALRLLDLVADSARPPSAKRLARLSDMALPTTYHLLRTLVHEGYLERSDDGYVLGDRPFQLVRTGQAQISPQRVRSVLHTVHADLNAATYVGVLRAGEIVLTDIVDSPAAPRADLWVGLHESAHATALGKAILAALSPEARSDYIARHPLVDLTRHTLVTRKALLAELEQSPGVTVDRQEYVLGTACVAVPIQAPGVVGAIAVSAPVAEADRLLGKVEQLRRAAHLVALAHNTAAT